MDLRIDFVTSNTTRKMNTSQKCDFIINKLQNDRVLILESGLEPAEEAELIQEVMDAIENDPDGFLGYRIINPILRSSGFFPKRVRMTVIAPTNYENLSVALV